MDPIEKLLSELGPAHAPDRLDRAMSQMFGRADRGARVRRGFRSGLALTVALAIGLGIGYRAGSQSQSPSSLPLPTTYIIPASSEFVRALEPPDSQDIAPARTGSIVVSLVKSGTV